MVCLGAVGFLLPAVYSHVLLYSHGDTVMKKGKVDARWNNYISHQMIRSARKAVVSETAQKYGCSALSPMNPYKNTHKRALWLKLVRDLYFVVYMTAKM
jgi:hypothetical protein